MSDEEISYEKCVICHTDKSSTDLYPIADLAEPIMNLIQITVLPLNPRGLICYHDLNRFRNLYIKDVINQEKSNLSQLETDIDKKLWEAKNKSIQDAQLKTPLSKGQKITDVVARFGGSWKFIITFSAIIVLWIFINSILYIRFVFDPYPFILLNLLLSCVAALQAPIIMMSQNRQETKDRKHLEHDYQVNLKAELEIRMLHKKLDHLTGEWIHLLEIQAMQSEMLEHLHQQFKSSTKKDAP